MAHWFDNLTQAHTRRSALKGAGLAAAAMLLPVDGVPVARAIDTEPCFRPCMGVADAAAEQAIHACDSHYSVRSWTESLPSVGAVLTNMRKQSWTRCYSTASVNYHEEAVRCKIQPDCGDPSSYPGGSAPTPVPVQPPSVCPGPSVYVKCGDEPCCDLGNAGCVSCNSGLVCCRIGGNCCGSSG